MISLEYKHLQVDNMNNDHIKKKKTTLVKHLLMPLLYSKYIIKHLLQARFC